jgi:hypothetical protein
MTWWAWYLAGIFTTIGLLVIGGSILFILFLLFVLWAVDQPRRTE